MVPILTISNICISCDLCAVVCPENAILSNGKKYVVDHWSCTLCQICIEACPVDCIKMIEKQE